MLSLSRARSVEMDLRCTSCGVAYDRAQHVPHFIPCGCDICGACVVKLLSRGGASRPPTPAGSSASSAVGTAAATGGGPKVGGPSSSGSAAAPTAAAFALAASGAFKCARGHVTPAATIAACPPVVAHRIAEQVRDKGQICPNHRRPLEFWCVPCRRALCGVCAVSHKEETHCQLPARPLPQCVPEVMRLSQECKAQIDHAQRSVHYALQLTTRMLKTSTALPTDLMDVCVAATAQFHERLLKSVDAIWTDHMKELRGVARAHASLTDMATLLESYKEKVAAGEKICEERPNVAAAAAGGSSTADPLPLAATLAALDDDRALKFPLKLSVLRGIEGVSLDATGTGISATWTEPFAGKPDLVPLGSVASAQAVAAAAMLDRASPQRRILTAARRDSPLSPRRAPMPPNGHVSFDDGRSESATSSAAGVPQRHAPLGLLTVTDVLNLGPRGGYAPPSGATSAAGDVGAGADTSSRRSTPPGFRGGPRDGGPPSGVSPAPGAGGASPYVQLHHFGQKRVDQAAAAAAAAMSFASTPRVAAGSGNGTPNSPGTPRTW